MAKKRTLPENIRVYKQEYLRLGVLEARLNHQLFKMKKRIKRLAEEEELRLSEKALLSEQLQQVHQQKTELESQPASKQRDTQLKRVEKEYKKVKAKHSRNQYQLDTLEVKKDKDNVAKLLLKEARRDDVRLRMDCAYETWMYLEQMHQYEIILMQSVVTLPDNISIHNNAGTGINRHISYSQDSFQKHSDLTYRQVTKSKPANRYTSPCPDRVSVRSADSPPYWTPTPYARCKVRTQTEYPLRQKINSWPEDRNKTVLIGFYY